MELVPELLYVLVRGGGADGQGLKYIFILVGRGWIPSPRKAGTTALASGQSQFPGEHQVTRKLTFKAKKVTAVCPQ
jgi:cytochrome oxidase assembly protein ShyY1